MKNFIFITLLFFMSINVYSQQNMDAKIKISTEFGDMILELYDDTPFHRDNFLKLVKDNFYNDQLFHRVIENFMIQGGDPNSKKATKGEMLGMGGPGYTIPAELQTKYYHKKGALAAARKGDAVNPRKESSGSQFYIIHGQVYTEQQLRTLEQMNRHSPYTDEQIENYTTMGGAPHLDGDYTIFGQLIEGWDVLDKIATLKIDAYNRPIEDVKYTISLVN